MNRKLTTLSFVLLLGAVGALSGCSREQQSAVGTPKTVRDLAVIQVRQSTTADLLEAVGTVRAAQTSMVSSQVMGNIVELRAREGDHVRRGEVIATIEDMQARTSVERAAAGEIAARQQLIAAESDLTLADSTLKRYQTLLERKSVSPQEFDEVKARAQAALAHRDMARSEAAQAASALTQARTTLDYTRIRAPFDGLITERKVDTGTLASPGMPLLTVEDVSRYRLEAVVNETDLQFARIGQTVSLLVDALGNTELSGKVIQIVPAADPASRSFVVKVELPVRAGLRSGLFGRAYFPRGERNAVMIPRTAVVERGQLAGVFVLDENKIASLRYITAGRPAGENVEVLAGLHGGEFLVAQPGERELDGKRIEVRP